MNKDRISEIISSIDVLCSKYHYNLLTEKLNSINAQISDKLLSVYFITSSTVRSGNILNGMLQEKIVDTSNQLPIIAEYGSQLELNTVIIDGVKNIYVKYPSELLKGVRWNIKNIGAESESKCIKDAQEQDYFIFITDGLTPMLQNERSFIYSLIDKIGAKGQLCILVDRIDMVPSERGVIRIVSQFASRCKEDITVIGCVLSDMDGAYKKPHYDKSLYSRFYEYYKNNITNALDDIRNQSIQAKLKACIEEINDKLRDELTKEEEAASEMLKVIDGLNDDWNTMKSYCKASKIKVMLVLSDDVKDKFEKDIDKFSILVSSELQDEVSEVKLHELINFIGGYINLLWKDFILIQVDEIEKIVHDKIDEVRNELGEEFRKRFSREICESLSNVSKVKSSDLVSFTHPYGFNTNLSIMNKLDSIGMMVTDFLILNGQIIEALISLVMTKVLPKILKLGMGGLIDKKTKDYVMKQIIERLHETVVLAKRYMNSSIYPILDAEVEKTLEGYFNGIDATISSHIEREKAVLNSHVERVKVVKEDIEHVMQYRVLQADNFM